MVKLKIPVSRLNAAVIFHARVRKERAFVLACYFASTSFRLAYWGRGIFSECSLESFFHCTNVLRLKAIAVQFMY